MERLSHVPVIAIVIALPSLSPAQEPPTFQFVDITARAGIDFTHVTGASGEKYMIETMGAGVVFFDYDGDLDPDLYLVNGGMLPGFQREESVTGALYRNDGQGRFSNVTAFSGLTFPGYGMGAAASDYDNDGDVDLYVTEFGPNRLFRNNGDGSFAEVAEWAGVVSHLWSVGASWSDLDGDGNLDLYVSNYLDFGFDNNPDCSQRKGGKVLRSYCLPDAFRGLPDALFRKGGKVLRSYCLPDAFRGLPDALFRKGGKVLRSYCLPDAFRGLPDALFRNRGDGTFEDVSQQAGIALPSGKGLGVLAFDYDGDGLSDLYVANDTVPNFLFRNHGGLYFTEEALQSGVAYDGDGRALAGMGVDVGDYDRDGDLDLVVTNFQGELNTLYRNDQGGFFTDVSSYAGVGRPSLRSLGFGTAFADLNNDGFLDIVAANGHVLDNTSELTEGSSYPQRNQIFWNRGSGRFNEVLEVGPGFELVKVSRGLAVADLEGDGDLDLLFANSGDRPDLLANETSSGNALRLLLIGRAANRNAVGARLVLDIGGDEPMTTEVRAGSSYASQNELVVHIGLGSKTEVPSARIYWPGAGEETLGPLRAGELALVVEGLGVVGTFPFR